MVVHLLLNSRRLTSLELKPAIIEFIDEYSDDLQLDYLTPADWKELKLTHESL